MGENMAEEGNMDVVHDGDSLYEDEEAVKCLRDDWVLNGDAVNTKCDFDEAEW